ncbi:hypothetical protein [Streptomyces thermolilacinus]|uniref:hypothetical protein n=1 Tax=Streptomyces thermolilacinus TaxID=285540 RepID=UPI0033D30A01
MTARTPVTGPFRIHVDPIPGGAHLDLTHYLTLLLVAIAETADEDPDSLIDDLTELAALARQATAQGADSHAAHERDTLAERLLSEFTDEGRVPVYGGQVRRLADRLRELAGPRPVPAREAGAA